MKKSIAIIGGGPAAMICAAFLDSDKYDIVIYEKNKALGRKFLVAGKGGFNLTHSEDINDLIDRYQANKDFKNSISKFSNEDLRVWLNEIGVPTFVGSSKRVYPQKGIKPIEVLDRIQKVLDKNEVTIHYNKEWRGWNTKGLLLFSDQTVIASDVVVFALGGGSWKVTGSAGDWLGLFKEKGIKTIPFYPSNCAYRINWDSIFINRNGGVPLKNIAITCSDKTQKGEVVITEYGLEGNAIYALSPEIRKQLQTKSIANIFVDFKPMLSLEEVKDKLIKSNYSKVSERLKKDLKLSKAVVDLLKLQLSKEDFLNPEELAVSLKKYRLEITGVSVLDEAISSVGGVSMDEIDEKFELIKLSNHYCIGEMLDWDAPTGGYLLQACFSMGVGVSQELNRLAVK